MGPIKMSTTMTINKRKLRKMKEMKWWIPVAQQKKLLILMMILWPVSKKKIERIKENLVHLNFFYYSSPNDDESITIQVSPSFVAKKNRKNQLHSMIWFFFNLILINHFHVYLFKWQWQLNIRIYRHCVCVFGGGG